MKKSKQIHSYLFVSAFVLLISVLLILYFSSTKITKSSNLANHNKSTSLRPSYDGYDPYLEGQITNNYLNVLDLSEGSEYGWKKYTNLQQGYSIEFPDSYTTQSNIVDVVVLFNQAVSGDMATNSEVRISINGPHQVVDNGDYSSLESYVKHGQSIDSGIGRVVWGKVNGYTTAIEGELNRSRRYYLFNEGYIYYIDVDLFDKSFNDEVNKVISTFTFLD